MAECEWKEEAIESEIRSIWADLLERPYIELDIHLDFISAGGYSLLAVALRDKICFAFGVEIPLEDILYKSTIKNQAKYVIEASRSKDQPGECGRDEIALRFSVETGGL